MSKGMTRRSLLGASLTVAAVGGGWSGQAFALDGSSLQISDLVAATYKIVGQVPANPFFARQIFAHITEHYSADSLNSLSALILKTDEANLATVLTENGLIKMASDITNIWYSGTVRADTEEEKVIGYIDNMAWQAIKFSTPQSVCGGHFGHWHKIPTGQ